MSYSLAGERSLFLSPREERAPPFPCHHPSSLKRKRTPILDLRIRRGFRLHTLKDLPGAPRLLFGSHLTRRSLPESDKFSPVALPSRSLKITIHEFWNETSHALFFLDRKSGKSFCDGIKIDGGGILAIGEPGSHTRTEPSPPPTRPREYLEEREDRYYSIPCSLP